MIKFKIKKLLCEELKLPFKMEEIDDDLNLGFLCPFCLKEVKGKAFAIRFMVEDDYFNKFHIDCLDNLDSGTKSQLMLDGEIFFNNIVIDFSDFYRAFAAITFPLVYDSELLSPEEYDKNVRIELEKEKMKRNKRNKRNFGGIEDDEQYGEDYEKWWNRFVGQNNFNLDSEIEQIERSYGRKYKKRYTNKEIQTIIREKTVEKFIKVYDIKLK